MTESDRSALARVLLSGVNLREGQCLSVRSEPIHWPFLTVLAEEAYRRGAKYVRVEANHAALYKARVDYSREVHLSYVPGYRAMVNQHVIDEGWARIIIAGQEDPDLHSSLDPKRNGIARKALAEVDAPLRRATQSDRIRWLVTALPTPRWAARVLGSEPGQAAADELWRIMSPIMRLDEPDPVAAWQAHGEVLGVRQKTLADRNLDAVRFVGPGTDLTVGLPTGAVWIGGGSRSPDGRWFLPNLPTEEVFTTPHFARVSGEVALTRPALILGRPVEGARFRFEDGRVVEWSAAQGEATLAAFFESDERARYLGEVALVDIGSPIYQSGLIFHNTLFDENAACHIAFGSSYPAGIPGGDEMSADEYRAAGGNVATVHSDVMISSPEVDVFGTANDGSTVSIMEKGVWVLS